MSGAQKWQKIFFIQVSKGNSLFLNMAYMGQGWALACCEMEWVIEWLIYWLILTLNCYPYMVNSTIFCGLNESVTDQQTDTVSYRDAWAHLQISDKWETNMADNRRKLSGIGQRVSGNHGSGTMEPQLLLEAGGVWWLVAEAIGHLKKPVTRLIDRQANRLVI